MTIFQKFNGISHLFRSIFVDSYIRLETIINKVSDQKSGFFGEFSVVYSKFNNMTAIEEERFLNLCTFRFFLVLADCTSNKISAKNF